MCQYWKKRHTCAHTSDRPYIEMCCAGYVSNTVCADITTNLVPRPSHFPCYPCIRDEVIVEAREKHERAAEAAVRAVRDVAARKREGERVGREERGMGEGGAWMLAEGGSGKSKKKGKGGAGGGVLASPGSQAKQGALEESEKGGKMGGRAGSWGPKKILSRGETEVVLADVSNGVEK
ncbi:uncharacterized protein EKO05_0008916 [Ascochyta rabiei]|uniref:Uncharacterized protein n=1 Tax=Didymella rabiei TaxID=5454 RepID=A0A162ZC93_DIDRA|nr:uncharacterized protein EKO05_0008916 [Ascochyta rabiei]KZM20531.1 hypothetical protein ST47_g8330 [Ascochyta rabiei]UPX18623.1 hypothetical protein EKO05_0008916 [Ascochyta rabiei]